MAQNIILAVDYTHLARLQTSRGAHPHGRAWDEPLALRRPNEAEKDLEPLQAGLSVGVQTMVRANIGRSGVMFSLDTDTGFPRGVLINGAWALGEQNDEPYKGPLCGPFPTTI